MIHKRIEAKTNAALRKLVQEYIDAMPFPKLSAATVEYAEPIHYAIVTHAETDTYKDKTGIEITKELCNSGALSDEDVLELIEMLKSKYKVENKNGK